MQTHLVNLWNVQIKTLRIVEHQDLFYWGSCCTARGHCFDFIVCFRQNQKVNKKKRGNQKLIQEMVSMTYCNFNPF